MNRKKLLNIHPRNEENLDPKRLRVLLDFLYDGCERAIFPLYYINSNFRRAHRIFLWMARNNLRGTKLLNFFKNESPDGGGFLPGVAYILSRIDGKKYTIEYVNAKELR